MACLSPWAFGAVEAWSEGLLYLGVFLAAALVAVSPPWADRTRSLFCPPSLALAGLVVLALAQVTPLPPGLLRRVAPASAALATDLVPRPSERVPGDASPTVAPPAPVVSQNPELTVDAAARLAATWALFVTVLGLRGGLASLHRFGVAVAVNATLLSLFSVVQLLSWNGKVYWVREAPTAGYGGPFVCHNHLAAYLNLGLGFALSALVSAGRSDRPRAGGARLAAAYACGMIVVGVLVSLSRGGFVAMLVASAVTLAVSKPVPPSLRAGAGWAAALGVVAVLLASVGALDPYRRLVSLFGADAYAGRFEVWSGALRAWSDQPLWGVGLGTFSYATMRYFGKGEDVFYGHAEDEYLEFLTEGGVVGLALGLLALGGVFLLGRRALRSAADGRQRALLLGALFGLVALATQSLSDFPMHVPGVAVAGVVLAGHLCRAGLGPARGPAAPSGRALSAAAGLAVTAVSLLALWHGVVMARAESELAGGGVPPAGFLVPTAALRKHPMDRLEAVREHLERSLAWRPNWAEGHARLGLNLLGEYRAAVLDQPGVRELAPARAEALADPLWLHRVVHSAAAAGDVRAHEPVARYLVPAARCFLEARRCCPAWALPHAELAALDYLLEGGEPAPVYARRALRLAGSDGSTLAVAAAAAAQAGDLELAALCWRRGLESHERGWAEVADQAVAALPADRVLDLVVPGGKFALWFADRFYAAPESRAVRDRFLRAAVARLPHDRGLAEADRLHYEAQALARLGEAEPARTKMTLALGLEPQRSAWRGELVEWLIGWDRPREAHDLALLGLYFTPGDPAARRAVEQAAAALSVGTPGSAGPARE